MSKKYDLLEAVEDASKINYSVGVFATKFFYQVSGINALVKSMDSYVLSRFSQRLEYYIYEHNNLSSKQKELFYNDLKNNQQNLNFLYEFIEKTRVTTFDLHARLLARLSVNLIKNNELSYFESNLLSNISTLNDVDIKKIYAFLKEHEYEESDNEVDFKFDNFNCITTFNKAIQIGIIDGQSSFGFASQEKKREILKKKVCFLTPSSKELFIILNEILRDDVDIMK